tara:strand:- start:8309 stop:9070 length:762 start_codon:yes stop_codon:yes gene_type:complete
MDLGLENKFALVTGGSKGIGLAIAKILAAEGCNLHLASRTEADLAIAADDIRQSHNVGVEIHSCDLSQKAELDQLAANCADVDILVNNAGAIPRGGLADIDDDGLREAWELKLFGYINLSRHIYGNMKTRGSGVIANVIGSAAQNPSPGYIAGAMANVALQNFTIALGKESPEFGVRVVGVHPALTLTERYRRQLETAAERQLGDKNRWQELQTPMPFGRPTDAEEVANLVAFLVSEKASYTSGVVMNLTGGL